MAVAAQRPFMAFLPLLVACLVFPAIFKPVEAFTGLSSPRKDIFRHTKTKAALTSISFPRIPLMLLQASTSTSSDEDSNNNMDMNMDIAALEKQVMSSVQAQLDRKRVVQALLDDDSFKDPLAKQASSSAFAIPIASAVVASGAAFLIFHNLSITVAVLVSVFFVAVGDPVQQDSLAGALARILGRATLESYQASEPKFRAVARAVVTGQEEIVQLQQRLAVLQDENSRLRLWKVQRQAVDKALPAYSLDQLKKTARDNGVACGGTKSQLLMRLVKAAIVDL